MTTLYMSLTTKAFLILVVFSSALLLCMEDQREFNPKIGNFGGSTLQRLSIIEDGRLMVDDGADKKKTDWEAKFIEWGIETKEFQEKTSHLYSIDPQKWEEGFYAQFFRMDTQELEKFFKVDTQRLEEFCAIPKLEKEDFYTLIELTREGDKHADRVEKLLKYGHPIITIEAGRQISALVIAVSCGYERLVEIFCNHLTQDKNANLMSHSEDGLLHRCVKGLAPKISIIDMLLEHGCPINQINQRKETALHCMLQPLEMVLVNTKEKRQQFLAVIRHLCDRGADLELQDEHNKTALMCAQEAKNCSDIVAVLKTAQNERIEQQRLLSLLHSDEHSFIKLLPKELVNLINRFINHH